MIYLVVGWWFTFTFCIRSFSENNFKYVFGKVKGMFSLQKAVIRRLLRKKTLSGLVWFGFVHQIKCESVES